MRSSSGASGLVTVRLRCTLLLLVLLFILILIAPHSRARESVIFGTAVQVYKPTRTLLLYAYSLYTMLLGHGRVARERERERVTYWQKGRPVQQNQSRITPIRNRTRPLLLTDMLPKASTLVARYKMLYRVSRTPQNKRQVQDCY